MRRIISLLLIILIFLNLFGFYFLFIVQQAEIRADVQNNLAQQNPANCQVFIFTATQFAQLRWTENEKEFELKGRLYDVVRIKKSEKKVDVTVTFDSDETELANTFISLFSRQNDKDCPQAPLKNFITHFQQDYTYTGRLSPFFVTGVTSRKVVLKPAYALSSFVADNFTPPPQV